MIVICWFGIIPAGGVLFYSGTYLLMTWNLFQDGHLAEGVCMYFKERSSRAQRQAGEVQRQDTVIPCAFSFFPNSSAFTQAREYKEPDHRDAEKTMNGRPIIFNMPESKNRRKLFNLQRLKVVGLTGFEPATPCTPCRCATRLRYNPIKSDRPGPCLATARCI